MNFDLSAESLVLYFNLAFCVLVFLRAFIGFLRGTRKSIFYLICTIVVYVGGWLVMNLVINKLMNLDLGFITNFGISSTLTINDVNVEVTTAGQMINDIVTGMFFSGADITDSLTLELVSAVVAIVFRLIYFIILIILSDTVLKWIFNIVWLFVRPKKRENKKGKMKRPKPNFLSRLGGFGIGAVKGAFLLLILFFLIGGLASVVTEVDEVLEISETTEKYDLVLLGNSLTLVEEDNESNSGLFGSLKESLGEYSEYINLISGYRNTIPGKIYGTIKINGAGLDEYVFDELFSINIDYEDGDYKLKEKVQIRREIKTVLDAFDTLLEKDPKALDKISNGNYDQLNSEALTSFADAITELKIVNVIMPVAVEFVFLSDVLTKDNEDLKALLSSIDYKALRNGTSSIGNDIKKLGYVFVDALTLIGGQEDLSKIDFFAFDPNTVAGIFEKLGSLGILNSYAPIAVEYVLTMESVKKAVEDLGLDFDEVKEALLDIESWGDEVTQLGVIVSKVLDLGIKGAKFEEMDFSSIDISKVEGLVDAIFNSQLIEEALPILVNVGLTKVSESDNETIGKVITALNITKDTDWEEELTPLINVALVLLQSGLLSNDTLKNGKFTEALNKLTQADYEKIGQYLSESNLLTNALNEVIKTFLSGDKIELLKGVEIQVFTDEEIASGHGWTKEELTAILLTANDLLSSGILSTEEGSSLTDSFSKLSAETIDNIATHLSQSTFFKRNLSSILKSVFNTLLNTGEEGGLEITVLTEEEWTKTELSAIFNSVVDLVNIGLLNDDVVASIKELSDRSISDLAKNVSSSKFITSNFGSIIDFAISKADIGFEVKGLKEMTWDKNEIATILKAARDVLGFIDGKEVTDILGCSDQTMINNLLNSRVLVTSIGSFVKTNSEVDDSGNPKGTIDLTVIKGADKLTDDDWADTILTDTIEFTISEKTLTVNNSASVLAGLHANRLDVYANDEWVGYLDGDTFSFEALIGADKLFDEMPVKDNIVVKARQNGELRRIFTSFNVLFPDGNVEIEGIKPNIILDLNDEELDKLLASVILTETIRSIIIDLDTRAEDGTGDTTIFVDVTKIDAKGWSAEIKAMVKAVKVVLGEEPDLENANPDVNKILAANDEDLDKILASDIITDTLIKVLYDQSNYDYLGNSRTGGTILIPLDSEGHPYTLTSSFWRDQDETHPGEIRKLFKSIQTLFTKEDPVTHEEVLSIDFDNINADAIFDLTDAKVDTLLNSSIMNYTCADILEDVLYGADGALKGMIWEPDENKLQYVMDNQGGLFKTLINLKEMFGISYDGFDFDSFKNAIASDGDAYVMSEVLCGSVMLSNSFKTMFGKLIGDNSALSDSVRTKVTTNINSIESWANIPTYTTEKKFGELALLLRALTVLTDMDSASSISASTMNEPLQKLNASKVLQPVVSEILDKALDSVGDWKKTGTINLSSAEWSMEIEAMVDIVGFAETSFAGGLGSVSNASSLDSNVLENLIKYISQSRILDITNINNIVETAVNAIWAGAYTEGNEVAPAYELGIDGTINVVLDNPTQGSTTAATLTITDYTNDKYDAFVAAWAIEAVAIRDAIAQLNKVHLEDALNFSLIHDDVNNADYIGYMYLQRMIGRFLDKCEDSDTLQPTVANIAGSYSVTKGAYETWEEAFANASISF